MVQDEDLTVLLSVKALRPLTLTNIELVAGLVSISLSERVLRDRAR